MVETERLRLRPLAPADLAAHHAGLGSDPEVTWDHRARTLEQSADVLRARPAWGRGVATEAGTAALRHGFEALGLDRIVAVVRPENAGSKRVLAKLGLRFAAIEDHYGIRDVELWEIARGGAAPARRG